MIHSSIAGIGFAGRSSRSLPDTVAADIQCARDAHQRALEDRVETTPTWSAQENAWPVWQTAFNGLRTLVDKGDSTGSLIPRVRDINELEDSVRGLDDKQLKHKTTEFRERLKTGETLEEIRNEAFAVAREVCRRVTGMRPYDVQILAGLAIGEGQVAEMATGEGKTLAAVAPTYLNALAGKGAHVITVNETLAARDAKKMGPVYEFLGLTVGLTADSMTPEEKRAAYNSDITYGSNDIFGFDFLRDQTARTVSDKVITRAPFFALVDEVDQVLIDEATTPLIISGPGEAAEPDYKIFSHLVDTLVPKRDIRVNSETLQAELTERGYDRIENELSLMEALKQVKAAQADHLEAVESGDETAQAAALSKRSEAVAWGESAVKMRKLLGDYSEASYELEKYDRNRPSLIGRLGQRLRSMVGLHVDYDGAHREQLKERKEKLSEQRELLQKTFPSYSLFDDANSHRVRFLQAAVQARTLFHKDIDYAVIDGDLEKLEKAVSQVSTEKLLGAAQSGLKFQLSQDVDGATLEAESQTLSYSEASLNNGQFVEVLKQSLQGAKAVALAPGQDSAANRKLLLRQIASRQDGQPLEEAQVKLIDEFKGRIGEGRRFTSGLHQALEAKEGLTIRPEQTTIASTTYPAFFSRYEKFSGMTGTAASAAQEFKEVLGLEVVKVPRHKPLKRVDLPDLTFGTDQDRDKAIHDRVLQAYEEGTPVLVTTTTVDHNLKLSQALTEAGVPHHVLNTNSVKQSSVEELRIIGEAGRSGSVTIATNMAGRGQDIKPEMVNFKKLSADVMKWLEDPYHADRGLVVNLEKETQAHRLQEWMAARAQGRSLQISVSDDKYPSPRPGEVVFRFGDEQGPVFGAGRIDAADYPTGGLLVLGASRNQARRIDEQLQGRAGRQGKVGLTQFFVSLDDDLIEHNISKEKLDGLKSQIGQVGKSDGSLLQLTAKAQGLAESQSQSARVETMKQDEILKLHREEFYGFRNELLEAQKLGPDKVKEQFVAWSTDAVTELALGELAGGFDRVDDFLSANQPLEGKMGVDALRRAADSLGLSLPPFQLATTGPQELYDALLPQMKKLIEDGTAGLSQEKVAEALRSGMLQGMDAAWSVHLDRMDQLKTSVQLVGYIQKDPELELKFQAFETFLNTVRLIRQQATAQVVRNLVTLQRQQQALSQTFLSA